MAVLRAIAVALLARAAAGAGFPLDYCNYHCYVTFPSNPSEYALCKQQCQAMDSYSAPAAAKLEVLEYLSCRNVTASCGYNSNTVNNPAVWAMCAKANCVDKVLRNTSRFADDFCEYECDYWKTSNCMYDCKGRTPASSDQQWQMEYLRFQSCRWSFTRCGLTPYTLHNPKVWSWCVYDTCIKSLPAAGLLRSKAAPEIQV